MPRSTAAVVDVDRVIRIFNALLRLAEIDTGMRRSGFVPVNAAEVARQAVDFYLPAAELKGVTLSYRGTGPPHISGDPVLLAQAIGNLIDNALKYTSAGGAISVEVRELADSRIQITVADDGPGIPDEEKPKVSARFYRGDASRGTPGVGLGLTLVASVAKVHGGALELGDNHPGLRANMVISAQTAAALQPGSSRPAGGADTAVADVANGRCQRRWRGAAMPLLTTCGFAPSTDSADRRAGARRCGSFP